MKRLIKGFLSWSMSGNWRKLLLALSVESFIRLSNEMYVCNMSAHAQVLKHLHATVLKPFIMKLCVDFQHPAIQNPIKSKSCTGRVMNSQVKQETLTTPLDGILNKQFWMCYQHECNLWVQKILVCLIWTFCSEQHESWWDYSPRYPTIVFRSLSKLEFTSVEICMQNELPTLNCVCTHVTSVGCIISSFHLASSTLHSTRSKRPIDVCTVLHVLVLSSHWLLLQ